VLVSTRHLRVQCRPATLAQARCFLKVLNALMPPVEFRGKHLLHLLAPLCVRKTQSPVVGMASRPKPNRKPLSRLTQFSLTQRNGEADHRPVHINAIIGIPRFR